MDKNTDTHIVLLYLHRHRVNDLKNWLNSLANVARLNVTLVLSNNTVNHTEALLDTEHFFTLHNIEEGEFDWGSVKNESAIKLLWKESKRWYSNFKYRYLKARELLAKQPRAVVITYDDRMSSLLPILKASFSLGMPVFLPAILTTSPDLTGTTSNTLKPQRKVEFLIAWFAKKTFPHHVNQNGRLFYDALNYLVLLRFGAMPKRPWVKGSLTYTSKLGVESKLAFDKLVNAGVQKSKLELTGMPLYDLMDFSREDIPSQNLLLCALPQYGEHGAMNVQQALPIIEEILIAFKEFSGDVVISLHPRMDPEIYKPLVEKYDYQCVVGNIDIYLKKASLFFAASSSTTVYSSLLMSVPTVVFNHIQPRSNIFRDFASLSYIEQDAMMEISAVIRSPKNDLTKLMQADEQLLSKTLVTDGKCGKRNLDIILKLLN